MALFSRNEAEIFFPGARFSSARGREKSLFFLSRTSRGRKQLPRTAADFQGTEHTLSGKTAEFKKGGRPACCAGRPLLNVLGQSGDYLINVIVKGIWYVYSLLDILIVYTTDRMIHTKGRIQMNRKSMKIRVRTPRNAQDTSR